MALAGNAARNRALLLQQEYTKADYGSTAPASVGAFFCLAE